MKLTNKKWTEARKQVEAADARNPHICWNFQPEMAKRMHLEWLKTASWQAKAQLALMEQQAREDAESWAQWGWRLMQWQKKCRR